MTIVETLLVFLGIPLAVVTALAVLIFGRGAVAAPNRYRPGKAWTYRSVWYTPHPDALTGAVADRIPIEGASGGAVAAGGANGEW